MVLDMANTRLKDFFDIWTLLQSQEFSGTVLANTIEATFRRRRTVPPQSAPPALTPAFFATPSKQAQWSAYLRKGRIEGEVPPLEEIALQIKAFLMPPIETLVAGGSFTDRWPPGGPWGVVESSG